MITTGIDVGSSAVKVAVVDDDRIGGDDSGLTRAQVPLADRSRRLIAQIVAAIKAEG